MTLLQVRNIQKSAKDAKRCTKGSLTVGASLHSLWKHQTHQLPLSSSCAAMVSRTPIPESSTDRSGICTLTRCSLQTTAKAGAHGMHSLGAEQLLALGNPGCPQHQGRLQPHTERSTQEVPSPGRDRVHPWNPRAGSLKPVGVEANIAEPSAFSLCSPLSLSQCCQASQIPTAAPEPSFCISIVSSSASPRLPHRELSPGQNFHIKLNQGKALGPVLPTAARRLLLQS